MGWFLLGFLLYFLITLSERVLVAVSAYDMDQLRADDTKSAQRAYSIVLQLRSAMSALLLARLLVQVFVMVFSVYGLSQAQIVRSSLYAASQKTGWPAQWIWGAAALFVAFVFAILFRALQKINFQRKIADKNTFWLQRLGLFIAFWRKLFLPFIKKEFWPGAEKTTTNATIAPAETAAANSEKREIELLKSIVKFSDVTVKQVMQQRSKVVAVDFRTNFHGILATVRESEFSRLPIFDEDLDNVTGILYVKDLLPHIDKNEDFEWQSLIRTNVLLVPESKRGSELLEEFKREKMHMAIVVDEYGGSAGIVTLEDILEEITGDIRDEFDEESDIRFRKMDDFNYLFEGQTLLNDVCRVTGLDETVFDEVRSTSDTLAGLALELRGDIPKTGTEIAWNGYLFTITAANNRRIEQLKLTLPRN